MSRAREPLFPNALHTGVLRQGIAGVGSKISSAPTSRGDGFELRHYITTSAAVRRETTRISGMRTT